MPGVAAARTAARSLERWGSNHGWRGPDPYDALNSRRLSAALRVSPLARRALTQAVKRSPVNLRPILGAPPGLSAATLAMVISAHAQNGFLEPSECSVKLRRHIAQLEALRCPSFPEPCWGYHFDVQTRVFFYPSTMPNTIATAFAALALLDAYELAGEERALQLAVGAGEFFVRHVPQTGTAQEAYFGYLPGDRAPIHNASMLVCALLARLSRITNSQDLAERSLAGVRYTVSRQRADGSWPYGERPNLRWVDGFHTGYVLDSLLTSVDAGVGGLEAADAWRRGLRFYVNTLVEPDGTPRYTPASRYPVDGQCAAQAIHTLARATRLEPVLADRRWDVLGYALRRLALQDGTFAFARHKWWVNRTVHPRWVQAPMLLALAQLIATGE